MVRRLFWKKKQTYTDEVLGTLSFSRGSWSAEPLTTPTGKVWMILDGGTAGPDPSALNDARKLAADPEPIVARARRFAAEDEIAAEFVQGNGALVVDGFSISSTPGDFTVNFGCSDWPDGMIEVSFQDGSPAEVLLSD